MSSFTLTQVVLNRKYTTLCVSLSCRGFLCMFYVGGAEGWAGGRANGGRGGAIDMPCFEMLEVRFFFSGESSVSWGMTYSRIIAYSSNDSHPSSLPPKFDD